MPMGYTFGGRHIHEFLVEMTGKNVPMTPPIKNLSEEQGGIDGGWDFGIQYEPKIITIDHYILANTREERQNMIRELAGWLNPRLGARELIFDDEPDKMYYARLSEQFALEKVIGTYSDFSLNFICYDPFTYSVQEYTQNITGSGQVEHLGTHVSKPILIVDHRGGSATVTNQTQDGQTQTLTFASTTPPGIFTIDMKEGTVKLGTQSGEKYIDSIEWFELEQGMNTITHSGNINQVTVKYRHTWL